MIKLTETIQVVLDQQKDLLSDSTYESRKSYFNQLLKLASNLDIDVPCQELYNAFTARANESCDLRFQLFHCIKLVDAVARTRGVRADGSLYNEPELPSEEHAEAQLMNILYPVYDIDLGILIVKARQEMKYLHLSKSTAGQYIHAWKDIYRYFYIKGSTQYSPSTLMNYIDAITVKLDANHMMRWKWKMNRKAALVLKEVAETGRFQWKLALKNPPHCSDSRMDGIRKQYCRSLEEKSLTKSTIDLHDYVFRTALEVSDIRTVNELTSCSPIRVQSMIRGFSARCSQRSMSTILPILRHILEYYFSQGIMKINLSGMVMSAFVQKGHVSAYIAPSDEGKLLSQFEQSSRRDKAAVLLALKLGLRDCDICNLTFQEIDWKKDCIRLIQKKTGEPLVLPLLPDVGNALMDYILNERPKQTDNYPYVFLREQAPFNHLTSIYMICSRMIRQAGIEPVNGGSFGSHLMRYTLVNRMLAARVPHQVITDTLGHTSKESDKPYLSMEESMLRQCALDLSVIGKKSWKDGELNG